MSSGEAARVLRRSPVFAALPDREIDILASHAVERAFRAREYLFMEGDPAQWLWVVRSGHVRIVRHSRAGKDVVLELLGPGDVIGGIAAIEKRPYPAAAQATEPTTVLQFPADALASLAERHPSIVRELVLIIGRRLRSAHDAVTSLAVDPVDARLAATLLRLAEREGGASAKGTTLAFHLTRQNLADMTGTTVETAIRTISRWQRDGLVRDEAGRLVLLDLDALRQIADATD